MTANTCIQPSLSAVQASQRELILAQAETIRTQSKAICKMAAQLMECRKTIAGLRAGAGRN